MDKYRRKETITDLEINIFKESEINKLIAKTSTSKKFNSYQKPLRIAFSAFIIILLTTVSIIIFNPKDKLDYDVISLSNNSYLVESITEESSFKLYYTASIVTPGERTNYNSLFDYYVPYNYVSDTIVHQQDITFNVFKLNKYRYFIEVKVNEVPTYLEIHFFKTADIDKILENLEIDDLEQDITDIYNLIAQYPPVINRNSAHPWVYDINPEIDALADSKAKRNYAEYVRNYYVDESLESDEDNEARYNHLTVYENHVIVVDNEGNITSSHFDFAYAFGVEINPNTLFSDYNSYFNFLAKDDFRPLPGMGYNLENQNHGVNGFVRTLEYDEKTYIYTLISLINSDNILDHISYVIVTFDLVNPDLIDVNSFEIEPLYYNKALILPPVLLVPFIPDMEILNSISYQFYDSEDNLMYEFDFQIN